jgi:glucokinase
VGCPGLITPVPGVVRKSPNLPHLMGFPLRQRLAETIGLPVELQNDANAAVLGEYLFGPNRGTGNLILLTLGTGVGGGAIVDGRLLLGADNAAAEFGHLIVEYGGALCACGKLGCIEAYAGAAGISRMAGEMMGNGKLTSREVAEMARQGDSNARQVLHTVGGYLGRCMGTLIDAFNPETIVVGGGASAAFDLMLPGIREGVEETCSFAETRERTKIERSAFSDEINVIGAAAIYLNLHRS